MRRFFPKVSLGRVEKEEGGGGRRCEIAKRDAEERPSYEPTTTVGMAGSSWKSYFFP